MALSSLSKTCYSPLAYGDSDDVGITFLLEDTLKSFVSVVEGTRPGPSIMKYLVIVINKELILDDK